VLISGAAAALKRSERLSRRGNVFGFFDHACPTVNVCAKGALINVRSVDGATARIKDGHGPRVRLFPPETWKAASVEPAVESGVALVGVISLSGKFQCGG
jgi:hypothetical protein